VCVEHHQRTHHDAGAAGHSQQHTSSIAAHPTRPTSAWWQVVSERWGRWCTPASLRGRSRPVLSSMAAAARGENHTLKDRAPCVASRRHDMLCARAGCTRQDMRLARGAAGEVGVGTSH
jgi:hypothetical protein